MNYFSHLLSVARFRFEGNAVPIFCTIENGAKIELGGQVRIDPGCVLKGSHTAKASMSLGQHVRVRRNCYLSATYGRISIGEHSLIAHNCWIGGHGSTSIGSNTLIGPGVVIVSSNHDMSSDHFPAVEAPEIASTIQIGKNCWVGANSTIVPGVKIGDECVVAGGSVVTQDVPARHLAAGNPAKVVKRLKPRVGNLYKEEGANAKGSE